jgi:hypothetical protein
VRQELRSKCWEKQAIISFHLKNPLEGYRRLTFMHHAEIVAMSPTSRLARVGAGGTIVEVEEQTVEERNGL